ncbi:MobQ family relaxase [Paenibacillus sp. FSL M7-0656]|uniref:MobQ family relaxase n=1 Tax=Paenibacillus sp. FSL M7-0656 TaxID=2921534 RepID=UPI0030FB98FA
MAIFHFSAQVASRSAGKSAVAMAAYRSGERLIDERTGEIKSYARDVQPETEIMAPSGSPEWVYDRNKLWNSVEMAEKNKNAQLCREIVIALPVELSADQQKELLTNFVKEQFVDQGMIADLSIHRDNPENPHAHVMLTMRPLNPDGSWAAKSRKEYVLDDNGQKIKLKSGQYKSFKVRTTDWDNSENMGKWREGWANHTNQALEKVQSPARIDHRSLAAQGITDRLPTIHEGVTARDMDRKGKNSDRGSINRSVKEYNTTVTDLRKYAAMKKEVQAEIQKAKTPEEICAAHNQMYQRKTESQAKIGQAEGLLQKINKLKDLAMNRGELIRKLEELKPHNLWQKMRNPNQNEIVRTEQDLERLQTRIDGLKKEIPDEYQGKNAGKAESQLNEQLSALHGAHKAIEQAFRSLDQERERMQQQQIQQRLRDQARAQRQNPGQNREREH